MSSPLYVYPHCKASLLEAVKQDTRFLGDSNIIDYSLVVGMDKETNELVVGIVDYVRTYTWDKRIEHWVKESGLLGGGGKAPTIVSPLEYKARFRAAMAQYFLASSDR